MKLREILFFIIVLLAIGCDQPKNDPHNSDPIYNTYKKELDDLAKISDETKTDILKSEASILTLEPGSNQKKDILDDMFEKRRKMEKINERRQYLAIKLSERKSEDKISYLKAFKEKKTWPDPEEIKNFELKHSLESKKGQAWSPEIRIKELLPSKSTKKSTASNAEGENDGSEEKSKEKHGE